MSTHKLNSQQQEAVTHPSGPLLIVAGAGTGKTTVLTQRIHHLISKKDVDPQAIFATTFTEKTAEEIIVRLDKVMPMGYRQPWIGTFHSLCQRLLTIEGLEIGLNPGFKIMSATDQWMFLREHIFNLNLEYYRPLGNPSRYISALIKFFSRLQDEQIDVKSLRQYAHKLESSSNDEEKLIESCRLNELANAYKFYQELKLQKSLMDYGDLINHTISLFTQRPNIAAKYRTQFQHILVDEFQDTNYAQFSLIKLLAPSDNNPNLIVVGDDDQSIYKFRGASVSNILQFMDTYPNAKKVVLTDNYRSTSGILDAAYRSIVNNNPDRLETKLSINKQLKSASKEKVVPPKITEFQSIDDEVDWTTEQIITLASQQKMSFKDIAVLTRSNNQLETYAIALKKAGIPYQLISNRGLFDQDEIKTLLHLLKATVDPQDTMSLFHLAHLPSFNINHNFVLDSINQSKQKSISLWEYWKNLTDLPDEVSYLVQLIDHNRNDAGIKPVTTLLFEIINQIDYINPLIKEETVENQLKIKNINLLFERLKQFERVSQDITVIGFLDALEMWLESGENPGQAQIEDIDTVSLMTVHAAKGLEFEAVFLGSLVAGRFPSINRKDPIHLPDELLSETLPEGDYHIQEERRLFYVAMTRAKQFLYLTHALDYGGKRARKPSGFLEETSLPINQAKHASQLKLPTTSHSPQVRYLNSGNYKITKVSYSQLDTFALCPLKYKYRYLLQVPAQPHHSLSFGRTIHATLHQFHQHQMQDQPLSLKELIKLYEDNFIDTGYDSETHRIERFKSGLKAIERYFKEHQKLFGQPKLLEQSFRLKLTDEVHLVGKIDRIDSHSDGKHELIDYKTGSTKDQKKVDKDDQLTIYSLAAKEALDIDIDSMSLYFIEEEGANERKKTTKRSPNQLAKAKDKLVKQVEELTQSDFPAKPNQYTCSFCEYNKICPFAETK